MAELRRRVVILGASNVTRSFTTLVSTARGLWNEPLEILAAHGHGRSYGSAWSTVLVRKLPGILQSGVWKALGTSGQPTAALVTDIGNDILYEYPVRDIVTWVETCLDRLAAAGAQTIVASLPVENVSGLSEARYKFFRNLFVPGCRLSLAETMDRAHWVNERVAALARDRNMTLVAPRAHWYGLDPIHIRLTHYERAWREVLSHWRPEGENVVFSREKLAVRVYLRSRLPERVRVLGRDFGAAQPSATLRDGTTIALY